MKKLTGPLALLLTAFLLTACGNDTNSGSNAGDAGNGHNDADVTFAQSMIPHHEQAIEMAQMASHRASTVQVKQLADRIEAAQGPEIDTLTRWLQEWGAEVPSDSTSSGDMGDMDHGDMGDMSMSDMPGMMSDQEMRDLQRATATEFDRMFLQMMIGHHKGAVEMSKTEVANGENADAIAMAKKIIQTQDAEIQQMQHMLQS